MRYLFCLAAIFSFSSYATLNNVEKAQMLEKNILFNPGFENGKQAWTTSYGGSGAFSIATSGSNLLTGGGSAYWDAAADTQIFLNAGVAVSNGLKSRNGVVACKILTPSGTATHTLEAYDGSNILGSVTIVSSTVPTYNYTNFIFPSSGSVYIRLQAHADEPMIAIDDCFMGDASEVNISNVSQNTFIGSAYIDTTASCQWTRANTALGAFGTDTDCPGPTVERNPGPGTIQTTDADLPRFTVNNLPPGEYEVTIGAQAGMSGGGAFNMMAITDGSVTVGRGSSDTTLNGGDYAVVIGHFTYSTAGNRTFELYGSSASGTLNIINTGTSQRVTFRIIRFPLQSEIAYTTDQSDYGWTAYTPTGSWSTNTTYTGFHRRVNGNLELDIKVAVAGAPTSASLTVNLPTGLTIDTTKLTDSTAAIASLDSTVNIRDAGTDLFTGIAAYNSTTSIAILKDDGDGTLSAVTQAAPMTWASGDFASIKVTGIPIVGWQTTTRAPQLVNSVVSPSNGVERITRVFVTNSGTPTVTSQSGNWVSSLTDGGAGITTVNFVAGTFSAAPTCTVSAKTLIPFISTNPSTSSLVVTTTNSGGTPGDSDFSVLCVGPK